MVTRTIDKKEIQKLKSVYFIADIKGKEKQLSGWEIYKDLNLLDCIQNKMDFVNTFDGIVNKFKQGGK